MEILEVDRPEGALEEGHSTDSIFSRVRLEPIEVEGRSIPDYQAIVTDDGQHVLGLHKERYRLITHEEAFAAVNDCVHQSGIDRSEMHWRDDISHHGARAFRDYHFPAERVDIGDEDEVCLRIIVVNSYDQSTALRLYVGAYRFVCSNGMMFGEQYSGFSHRHTGNLAMQRFRNALNEGLGRFRERSRQWMTWKEMPMSMHQAERLLENIQEVSKTRREEMLERFHFESITLGRTRWAFCNALTFWATHGTIRARYEENAPAIRMSRDQLAWRILGQMEHGVRSRSRPASIPEEDLPEIEAFRQEQQRRRA